MRALLLLLTCLMLASGSCSDDDLPPGDSGARDFRPGDNATREISPGDLRTDKPRCFIDFPCLSTQKFRCINQSQYQPLKTDCDCAKYCPPGYPCSGCTCIPDGPIKSCPAGQVCNSHQGGTADRCESPDAGVADAGKDS